MTGPSTTSSKKSPPWPPSWARSSSSACACASAIPNAARVWLHSQVFPAYLVETIVLLEGIGITAVKSAKIATYDNATWADFLSRSIAQLLPAPSPSSSSPSRCSLGRRPGLLSPASPAFSPGV